MATSSINKDFSRNHHRCTVEMCCWLKGLPGDRVPCGSVCVLVRRRDQICESRHDPHRFPTGGDKRPVLLWSIYFLLLCIKRLFLVGVFCFPRRGGAVYHSGHSDDDGRVVDVRSHRHLLVHGQPRSLPHHHTHRELHTVSILGRDIFG